MNSAKITPDEFKKFEESFKNKEFRSLFFEYMNEISDPKNRELYEQEIQKLEAEKGYKVQYIKPTPGFVVKITSPKTFINICSCDLIEKPTPTIVKSGTNWSIPYSISAPRDDVDHQNIIVKVYDVVFHPDTIEKSFANQGFQKIVISTAIEGLSKNYTIPKGPYKILKMKSKGTPTTTMIRIKDDSLKSNEETSVEYIESIIKNSKQASNVKYVPPVEKIQQIEAPEYQIIHQNLFNDYQKFTCEKERQYGSRPDSLLVKIKLEKIDSAREVDLDITESSFHLEVAKKYELNLNLPFAVDKNNGKAKFDTATKTLSVTLPVIPAPPTKTEPSIATPSDDIEAVEQDDLVVDMIAQNPKDINGDLGSKESEKEEMPPPINENEETEPSKVESEKAEPSKVESDKAEPSKVESEKAEPSKVENLDNINEQLSKVEIDEKSPIINLIPPFQARQDDKTCSIIVDVENIEENSVRIDCQEKTIDVNFIANSEKYNLKLSFESAIESKTVTSVSADNLVINIEKKEPCSWLEIISSGGSVFKFLNMDNVDSYLAPFQNRETCSEITSTKAKTKGNDLLIHVQQDVAIPENKPIERVNFVNDLLFDID